MVLSFERLKSHSKIINRWKLYQHSHIITLEDDMLLLGLSTWYLGSGSNADLGSESKDHLPPHSLDLDSTCMLCCMTVLWDSEWDPVQQCNAVCVKCGAHVRQKRSGSGIQIQSIRFRCPFGEPNVYCLDIDLVYRWLHPIRLHLDHKPCLSYVYWLEMKFYKWWTVFMHDIEMSFCFHQCY